jgi:hypothetical protein
MSVKVTREPTELESLNECENCFNCDTPTAYWHANDVACCPPCSRKIPNDADVPSKEQWFANEEAKSKAKAKAFWQARIDANKTKPKKPAACTA